MSDWLWRNRALVALVFAVVTVAVLFRLARHEPAVTERTASRRDDPPATRPPFASAHGVTVGGQVASDDATSIAEATV